MRLLDASFHTVSTTKAPSADQIDRSWALCWQQCSVDARQFQLGFAQVHQGVDGVLLCVPECLVGKYDVRGHTLLVLEQCAAADAISQFQLRFAVRESAAGQGFIAQGGAASSAASRCSVACSSSSSLPLIRFPSTVPWKMGTCNCTPK